MYRVAGYNNHMNNGSKKGRPPHQDLLTPAEWRVVSLAQHGLTNQLIADKLQVSINAVKYHIANAVGKLQVLPGSHVKDKKSLLTFLGAPKDSPFHKSKLMNKTMNNDTPMQAPIQAIGQISRTVNNIEQSEHWYREKLGLKHLYTFGKLAFFDLDGVRLFLSEPEENNSTTATPESIIYFKTNDIKSSHQELTARGIKFSHVPHKVHTHEDGTEEWMAFFNDLEGRPLGLMGQLR